MVFLNRLDFFLSEVGEKVLHTLKHLVLKELFLSGFIKPNQPQVQAIILKSRETRLLKKRIHFPHEISKEANADYL
jgi:hypothetical protein